MKRIIVTGAGGFIGRHCLPLLQECGYEIHAISSQPRSATNSQIIWHHVDFLNGAAITDVLQKVGATHALHLAWCTTPGKYWTAPENLDWVSASLHFAREFVKNGGKHLVIAGTCAEYEWKESILKEDSSKFNPAALYGVSKRSLFMMLEKFCSQMGVRFAWGYIFYLFGPGEAAKKFIPQLINGLSQGIEVKCSSGEQMRDFLYVSDVASAFVALLESSAEGAFNIGSGRGISLKEIAEKIEKKMQKPGLIKLGALQSPAGDPSYLIADVRKISAVLNWEPKIDLEEGLKEAINWWGQLK